MCVCVSVSIYGTDALLSSLSVKPERRDKREKSDHDRKKSYFEKPAEVWTACFMSSLLCGSFCKQVNKMASFC